MHRGNSRQTVRDLARRVERGEEAACDLWFLDGAHSRLFARDLPNALAAAAPGALVMVDDVSARFPKVQHVWQSFISKGLLRYRAPGWKKSVPAQIWGNAILGPPGGSAGEGRSAQRAGQLVPIPEPGLRIQPVALAPARATQAARLRHAAAAAACGAQRVVCGNQRGGAAAPRRSQGQEAGQEAPREGQQRSAAAYAGAAAEPRAYCWCTCRTPHEGVGVCVRSCTPLRVSQSRTGPPNPHRGCGRAAPPHRRKMQSAKG